MTDDVLGVLVAWLEDHQAHFETLGVQTSLTWGPADRTPRGAFVDFDSSKGSARLLVWANGEADLSIIDIRTSEVLLDEHREITGEVGLDDVEATVVACLTG